MASKQDRPPADKQGVFHEDKVVTVPGSDYESSHAMIVDFISSLKMCRTCLHSFYHAHDDSIGLCYVCSDLAGHYAESVRELQRFKFYDFMYADCVCESYLMNVRLDGFLSEVLKRIGHKHGYFANLFGLVEDSDFDSDKVENIHNRIPKSMLGKSIEY